MGETRDLPPAMHNGRLSLEAALNQRRTCREFSAQTLDDRQIGQLLWAALGKNAHGRRTCPSAGGLNPLEILAVLPDGVFSYDVGNHSLRRRSDSDLRRELGRAALAQEFVQQAPLTLVVCAAVDRTARRYGAERGARYVLMEAGHAAQNVLLQATALGLGAVPVGAFDDLAVHQLLGLPPDLTPVYLVTIGQPLAT